MAKISAKKARRDLGDPTRTGRYGYKIERVWFDGHIVFATEQGEVDVDPKKVKVASSRTDRC